MIVWHKKLNEPHIIKAVDNTYFIRKYDIKLKRFLYLNSIANTYEWDIYKTCLKFFKTLDEAKEILKLAKNDFIVPLD